VPPTRGGLHNVRGAFWRAVLLALLTLAVLASRTAMPIDETRYLAVAWEMWQRGDFLVPFRNGEAYSHKPPLLFWLFHAGWAVFGVNDVWPRLLPPLLALATLGVTTRIASTLWPDAPWRAERSAWVLLGCLVFVVFATMVMFDMLLALCVSLGVLGLASAPRAPGRGFTLLAVAIGGGVLAKGPVVLLHLLPAALLAPWWLRDRTTPWLRWYAGVALALLGGAAIALAWAIPAGLRGGEAYRNAIFWGQTAHRMVDSFAHRQPIWFYAALLPVLAAPWILWMPFWRGLRTGRVRDDRGGRLALILTLVTFVAFSLVSGKQVHYLVPQFPAFALLVARVLDRPQPAARPWLAIVVLASIGAGVLALPHVKLPPAVVALHAVAPTWSVAFLALAGWLAWSSRPPERQVPRMAAASVLMVAVAHLVFVRPLSATYDVRPLAGRIAEWQAAGRPVAHDGVYHAQYQFAGRLGRPVEELSDHDEARRWFAAHPDGAIVLYFRPPFDPAPLNPLVMQRYRGRIATLFDAHSAPAALDAAQAEAEPDAEREATVNPGSRPPR
jgi:4-amino-4-deoxy-L-arabinose transferase-like glycosyltransferase